MPEVTRTWILNNLIRPISPDSITDSIDQGLPDDWYGRCNGITIPRGKTPGEAHFLVRAADLSSLENGPITIKCSHENGVTSWPGWYYESHRATTKQSMPVFWVTLKDSRWLFEDSAVAGERYNLRQSATNLVEDTTNAGTAWTWQEVLVDLWGKLPAVAGTCPVLPYTPASTPENLCFDGLGAWRAINQVLTAIGCVVVRNPFTGVYTFARLGTTQTGLTAQLSLLPLLWDDRLGMDDLPQYANCLFHYVPQGANEYVPFRQAPRMEQSAIGGTEGKYEIVDTMFYWVGREAAVATRASEIGQALAGLLAPRANPMSAVYAGVGAITPGSQLTAVRWVSDGTRGFETLVFFEPEPIDWPRMPIYDGYVGGMIQGPIYNAAQLGLGGDGSVEITIAAAPPNRPDLIGLTARVIDLSPCILDLTPEEIGFTWIWAVEQIHGAGQIDWCAVNRCCVEG